MFNLRIDKLSDLKETDYFKNYEELQQLMNEAVEKDLKMIESNKTNSQPKAQNVKEVQKLKTKILQWYLVNTNDFTTSIYNSKVIVSEDKEVTETENVSFTLHDGATKVNDVRVRVKISKKK